MEFPWLEARIPAATLARAAGRAQEAARRELHERAALLLRMGFARRAVTRRLEREAAWEWEFRGRAPYAWQIERIVAEARPAVPRVACRDSAPLPSRTPPGPRESSSLRSATPPSPSLAPRGRARP